VHFSYASSHIINVLHPQDTEAIIVNFLNAHGLTTYVLDSSDIAIGPSPPLGFVNWIEGLGYVWYMDMVSSYSEPAPLQTELDFYVEDSNSPLASLYQSTLLPAVMASNSEFNDLFSLQVDVNPALGGGMLLPVG
jgi:hypothetical protein